MSTTYAQKQAHTQKKDANTASAVLDSSSQSEGLQRKADMANSAAQRAEAPRPNNTGMPDNLKAGIESLSGFSMDDVRVHYNSSKPATVQALAYTQGTDIHVAPGQEKHLPHEAWHVAQQMAGRVSPTTNINGMPVNDNAGLEHEADVMGAKSMQMKVDVSKTVQKAFIGNEVVQCAYSYDPNQNIIKGRPNETETIKKEKEEAKKKYKSMTFTAHHKYPWCKIKDDIQFAFTAPSKESSLKTLVNLEHFSGETFPETRASFLKSPNDRKTNYFKQKEEYDTWIQNVCWTPGNIFLGPLSDKRIDDPGNSFDGHYTRSRSMSIRSTGLKDVFDGGGLRKKSVNIQENAVAPYEADEWQKIDELYYQKHGGKIPFKWTYSYEKTPENHHTYDIMITVPKDTTELTIVYDISDKEQTRKEIKLKNSESNELYKIYSCKIVEKEKPTPNFEAHIKILEKEISVRLNFPNMPCKMKCDVKSVDLP